jgi:cardiolipin synthase
VVQVPGAGGGSEAPSSRRSRSASPGSRKGSTAAAGAIRVANVVGAAVTNRRVLGPAEGLVLGVGGLALAALGVVAVLWPRVLTVPLSVIMFWIGGALVWRAFRLRRARIRRTDAPSRPAAPPEPIPGER